MKERQDVRWEKQGGRGVSEKNPCRRKRWGAKEGGADTLTD